MIRWQKFPTFHLDESKNHIEAQLYWKTVVLPPRYQVARCTPQLLQLCLTSLVEPMRYGMQGRPMQTQHKRAYILFQTNLKSTREIRRNIKKGLLSRISRPKVRSRQGPLSADRTIDGSGSLFKRHNWRCGVVYRRRTHCLLGLRRSSCRLCQGIIARRF